MNSVEKVFVLGVPIAAINMREAVSLVRHRVLYERPAYVTVVCVHSVVEAQKNPRLMKAHQEALACTPDGMPLVWIGKLSGKPQMGRVYGPDLMEEILGDPLSQTITHFFLGGKSGVPELMAERFLKRFPNVRIVGTYSPPFRPMTTMEEIELQERINAVKPDILWVGLGCPKQEIWMAEHLGCLQTKLMIGVGAAFDFHAGLLRQAPDLLQNIGLEWAFRLCVEPKRLWRRYLVTNSVFIYRLIVGMAKKKKGLL